MRQRMKRALCIALRFAVGTMPFESSSCVFRRKPHAVCLVDDWAAYRPTSCSPLVLRNPLDPAASIFPAPSSRRIPAVFPRKPTSVRLRHRDEGIAMRVWERGCGETLACGTGACATNTAACLTGRAGRRTISC
ncbi:MAG: hypothetical protein ACLTDR_06850 [Adlercreutzia equolifaciens]